MEEASAIGRTLRDVFLGGPGTELLAALDRTALLMVVDETILHLPWEMALDGDDRPLVERPFGRVVTTRMRTSPGRDADTEDPTVRILAVENPTEDLAATERVMEIIEGLREWSADLTIEVITLARRDATKQGFAAAVAEHDVDIVHFAGHGAFDTDAPADGAVVLADGPFVDDEVAGVGLGTPAVHRDQQQL